ncbi:hypothetical protein BDF20DRAFT_955314 [Mycotypha africana]|uniref:uncharacterized protein n=1 Tax=Mycotypha africana TaxID=64632 RepID=UPI002300AAD1|nr:uncharacterized protein BDF20DRAFT_955314 [Mycotypha africana]KAI8981655.1 hypothetical protein BDF20DRAFT_955314 [Mycotypha africana]
MTNSKLIASLIKRIEVRLPINSSGKSIEMLEQDPLTQQTIAAIIELSIHKLSIIVNQLALILESISKIYNLSTIDLYVPSEFLQSQLFILRLISACLQHHWQWYGKQKIQQQQNNDEVKAITLGNLATTTNNPSDDTNYILTNFQCKSSASTTILRSNNIHTIINPEPLEETLISFLMSLISRFLTQTHIIEERTEQNINSSSGAADHSIERVGNTANSLTKRLDSQALDYIQEIYTAAGKILYYTSASNWGTYYARIRNAVNNLSAINDSVAMNPPDIRILAFADLDIPRLHTVLSDLSPYFLNMRVQGKLLFAKMMRLAIWKWIETKPSQFAEIYTKAGSDSSMSSISGSEILFDMCDNAADSSRKKSVLWPLQTVLLLLTPGHLIQAFLDDHGLQNRRTAFPRQLKKALHSTRMQQIAAICYIHLCKAAVYIPPNEDNILRLIAADVEDTLRDKVWDFSRVSAMDTLSSGLGYTISHLTLLTDYFLTAVKLNAEKALENLIPPLVGENEEIPIVFRQAFINACLSIALDKDSALPWCPTLKSLYSHISAPLKRIFIHSTKIVLSPSLSRSEISNSTFVANKKQNGASTATISGTVSVMVTPITAGSTASNSERSLQPPRQMETILQSILRLFRLDPASALMGNNHGDDGHERVDENAATIISMINLMKYRDKRIRRSAAECIARFFEFEHIKQWGPSETLIVNFWKISSQTVLCLARQILDQRQSEEIIKSYLELLCKVLVSRNVFLRSLADTSYENTISHERVQSSVTLETALLVSLCSPIPDICSLATACLKHLCVEAKLVEDDLLLADTASRTSQTIGGFEHNIEIYEDLSYEEPISNQQGARKQPFIGRKAQQKRIRKYLRMISAPTPGVLTAWEEIWKRWKILTQVVSRFGIDSLRDLNEGIGSTTASTVSSMSTPSAKKIGGLVRHDKVRSPSMRTITTSPVPVSRIETDDEKQTEWQNYTGFLAALGGSRLAADTIDEELLEVKRPNKAHHDGNTSVSSTRPPAVTNSMVKKFISEMIELLTSENVMVREGAKDTLGGDISPALYAILFQHLEAAINNCFSAQGDVICDSKNTLLVEQTVLILKTILDRLTLPNDCLLSTDFGTLILQLANYINRLPHENYTTMRVMIKMCNLTEVLMSKKEQVIIRDDVRVRNKLLEIIIEWTSDFTLRVMNGSTKMSFSSSQNKEVQRDLDQVCLKAIVTILHKLPLQAVEQSRDTDRTMSKTRLFRKYFIYFTQLLDRCHRYEKESSSIIPRSNADLLRKTGRELQTLSAKPSELYQYWSPLKDSAVSAISNLLSANVDCGLQFTLAMGYHEDSRTRTAFMQVLSNILNQGAQFDTLAENIIANRYEKLVEIIVDSDIDVALALCDVCPSSEATVMCKVLLQCFESRSKVLTLLKAVIDREVNSTDQESTLFRGTNMATKILSTFARETCVDYIRFTLQPAMELINSLPNENLTWELDPQKLQSREDILMNRQNVCRATEIFLDAICNSTENAPRLFRQELALIVEAVNKRFPDASKTAVGGFVFLRLFNPAILTPENSGFSKAALPRSKMVKKLLLQATRIMQNLANNVMFGAKETHLISLNDFITSNLYRVANFLREISVVPVKGDRCIKEETRGIRMDHFAFTKLHCYMSDNLDKISRDLSVRRARTSTDTQKLLEWKRTMDKLSNLLAQLGPPSELSQNDFNTGRNYAFLTSNNNFYREFIKRNKHRDLSHISSMNIFYKGGNSKGGRPVFYLITRNAAGENVDFELLIYYMLRVMEPYLNHPFELLIDVSRFCEDVEIPSHWLNQFFQLIFSEMNDYLVALILYNPNFHMQRYVRKLPRIVTNKLVKRTKFAITLDKLTNYIAMPDIQLPKETLEMEKVKGMTITNAYIVTSFKVMIPVNIKIGQDYLIVTTLREQEIFWSLNAILNNVFSMTDIVDIFMPTIPSSKRTSDEGELHIVHDSGKATMVLIVPNCEEIYRYLLERKKNFETNFTNVSHGIRPTDVPGRILNMALLNMASDDPTLRTEAHNLLCSLCISFRFGCDRKLMKTKDICIPSNSVDFIVAISENLAQAEAHLTLEFLNECILGFNRSSKDRIRQLTTLDYMVPWLKNLALFVTAPHNERNALKVKDVIRSLIVLTAEKSHVYQHIQKKVWNTLKDIEELHNLVLDALVQYSVENGIGSPQAEVMADTIVTLNTHAIRGKVLHRMRKVLSATSQHYRPSLTKHPLWHEIGCLIRFMLMLSFYSESVMKHYLAEVFHIIALIVATGPTFIRSSVHEFVVNVIHALVTNKHITADDRKKLKYILDEVCDGKYRVHFGLNKTYANAFTITEETMTDNVECMNLGSLEVIVRLMIDVTHYAAPTIDIANIWRARWTSLVASMTFQHNPALQPRAFVILGCLAQEDIDDDLMFQILTVLRNELARFDEKNPCLVISILMCLTNIIDNLSDTSRYLKSIFWLAVAMVEMNHSQIFSYAVNLLHAVLRTLDTHNCFQKSSIRDVFMEARFPYGGISQKIDKAAGLSFDTQFSFAISVALLKGFRYPDARETVFTCLTTFLEIETKSLSNMNSNIVGTHLLLPPNSFSNVNSRVHVKCLGYLCGLLPFAVKNDALKELLQLAGVNENAIDLTRASMLDQPLSNASNIGINDFSQDAVSITAATHHDIYTIIWRAIDIPNNTTGVLLVSFLIGLLSLAENESERLFLYGLLARAAVSTPEIFALIYDSLIPKMNSIVVSSNNPMLINSVKDILMTACSETAFKANEPMGQQHRYLEEIGFSALGEVNFGSLSNSTTINAALTSELLNMICE